MSLHLAIVWSVTLVVLAYGFWRGARPERRGAVIIAAWFAADPIYHLIFGHAEFRFVDPGHVVMDGLETLALGILAVRANRIWPLWAAGAELIAISGHLALAIGPHGLQRAYWAMTQPPLYVQLAALLIGTFLHQRRFLRIGPYRDWRPRR